jgi:chemotaxis protein MotB
MRTHILFGYALSLATMGCVSTGTYDAALADAARAKAALEAQRQQTARVTAQKAAAEASCQKELDEATAVNQELRAELVRLGQDADQLLAAKGALEQARARLDELRKAQAAAEARSALYRELAIKLKSMIDAGDLQITLRSGRMVLVLPNDVLFDSGKASLKPNGKETLELVAAALATIQKRRFQVSGHTDNEPIRFSGFTSNWQLSSERALAVVGLLIQSGMHAETLSAAGYGEFDPVAANDNPEGKARNRRTEIVLQPNIDELVAIPQAQK